MSDVRVNSNGQNQKVSHKFLIFFGEDPFRVLLQENSQSVVVSDLDGRHKLKSKLYNIKWWLSTLLAIFACLQIVRGVGTTRDSTAKQHKPQVHFPDLYEASVLELQQGLDEGHFSSVDLVKVVTILCTSSHLHLNLVYTDTGVFCPD